MGADSAVSRYTASLDLLGERTEEVEELRQDLQDVKVRIF